MTKYSRLIVGIALGMCACSGKDKADVAEKGAQLVHNAAQCPKLQDGYYDTGVGTDTKFIEVYNDLDQKRIELNINGIEQVPVDGKDTPQKNGFRLTGACIDNTIRVVGKTKEGELTDTQIKLADDGGLQVEQKTPKVPAIHYAAAGAIKTPIDQIKNWFTSESAKKSTSGIPEQRDQKPQKSPAK